MAAGFALHVGIDGLDPITFPHAQPLSGCAGAAGLMAAISAQQGFAARTTMTNGQATFDEVSNWWTDTIRDARPGDLVVFSFAGHGDSVQIAPGQPPAQTFALFNREVSDQEFLDVLRGFPAGVRVVVIADSCFSGGLVDVNQPMMTRALRARRVSTFGAESLEAVASSPTKTKKVLDARALNVSQVSADVLLIAASPTDLKAVAAPQGAPFSLFSKALKQAWDNKGGHFGPRGYRELFDDLKALSPDNDPVLVETLVKTASFPSQPPFTI